MGVRRIVEVITERNTTASVSACSSAVDVDGSAKTRNRQVANPDRTPYFTIANVLAAVAALSIWYALPREGQELIANGRVHHFGNVRQMSVLNHEFKLTNRSRRHIAIVGLAAACDCSKATVSENTVGPSESATLTARWDVGRRRGRSQTKVIVDYLGDNNERRLLAWIPTVPEFANKIAEILHACNCGDVSSSVYTTPGRGARM